MMNFEELAKARRSAVNFVEGVEMTDEDFHKIFELTKLSPSCFNLQHAHYVVVRDKETKELIKEAGFRQHKIHTASAVVLVFGDKDAYQNVENIYMGMKMLKMIDEWEYENIVNGARGLYESKGERFQEEEAIRNAALSAMSFMYAAQHYGWETCPMIGFDEDTIKSILNAPDNMRPALMITIGKGDETKIRKRGYRKPMGEFVKFDSF
ncbi:MULTISPECIES: nitroreductase family protein [Bacillus cereus group]|nr:MULTISPECIES: nitroreductase family protein [Bacillus cereus group]MDA1675634.1 nitroreductase family protein [Bacillus cereus group sp. TH152-1LC]